MADIQSGPAGDHSDAALAKDSDASSESSQSTVTVTKDSAQQSQATGSGSQSTVAVTKDSVQQPQAPGSGSQSTVTVTKDSVQQPQAPGSGSRNKATVTKTSVQQSQETGSESTRASSSASTHASTAAAGERAPSNLNTPSRVSGIQTDSSVSLSFKGIRVNFHIEFAQLALNLFTWVRDLFASRQHSREESPPEPSGEGVSHLPRRVAFMLISLAIVTVGFNWSYSYSTSPCLWKAHTDALAQLEMSRIGTLLNGTAHGTGRITDLASARLAISELRTYVQEHHSDGPSYVTLDATLQQYGEELSVVLQKLLRMDASVTALVHITIAHDAAMYEHLDMAGHTPWWLTLFCWSACQGPSFEVIYVAMLSLEDAILHALEATLYDSTSLKDGIQRLYNRSSQIQHHVNVLGLPRASSAPDGQLDALSSLWDAVAPYRTPATMKANRRRSLSAVRVSQRRSMDYALATHEGVLNLMEKMRLLKLGLKARARRSVDTSWIAPSRLEVDQDLCSPHAEQGMRAFKSLLLAANELRGSLARRS